MLLHGLSDVIDYYDHEVDHEKGLDGLKRQVYQLTGGVGPSEFPRVYECLNSDTDWQATFNVLISVMRSSNIGEAIVEFNRLVGKKTFSDSITLMKKFTGLSHLKYALEELLQETARVSLKVIAEKFYQLFGKSDLEHVQTEIQRLYHHDNIIKLLQTVNRIFKKRDPLIIFGSLLDITQTSNLSDCSAVITGLTFRQCKLGIS
nr:uncharacterized protein LOC113402243 [Vanessa tameamea]